MSIALTRTTVNKVNKATEEGGGILKKRSLVDSPLTRQERAPAHSNTTSYADHLWDWETLSGKVYSLELNFNTPKLDSQYC